MSLAHYPLRVHVLVATVALVVCNDSIELLCRYSCSGYGHRSRVTTYIFSLSYLVLESSSVIGIVCR